MKNQRTYCYDIDSCPGCIDRRLRDQVIDALGSRHNPQVGDDIATLTGEIRGLVLDIAILRRRGSASYDPQLPNCSYNLNLSPDPTHDHTRIPPNVGADHDMGASEMRRPITVWQIAEIKTKSGLSPQRMLEYANAARWNHSTTVTFDATAIAILARILGAVDND